ncbi:MAG: protoporphyrinogen oxidase HemJ [Alphaproteobacteria bacterium]|nr:protoporphyrinogen oxidase HemJ [Alphaproteobacteria bacterium]
MDLYGVIKSLHVISVIAWMAGLLYLPRLFVYHAETEVGSAQSELFKTMERRLIRAIMNPAMIATWVFGIWMLALTPDWLEQGWLHAKLLLITGLTAVHHVFSTWRKAFERDQNRHNARVFRIWNEVPTVIMVAVVFLVILKPF